MSADVLIIGDTFRSPELRHEVPLGVPDPFVYLEVGGERHVYVVSMEAARLEELGGLNVHPTEELAVDDIINLGHLGVAAAVWNDALADGLKPFACTPAKLYATLDEDDAETYASVVAELTHEAGNELRENVVGGTRILATWSPPPTLRKRMVARARRTLHRLAPWGVVLGSAALAS